MEVRPDPAFVPSIQRPADPSGPITVLGISSIGRFDSRRRFQVRSSLTNLLNLPVQPPTSVPWNPGWACFERRDVGCNHQVVSGGDHCPFGDRELHCFVQAPPGDIPLQRGEPLKISTNSRRGGGGRIRFLPISGMVVDFIDDQRLCERTDATPQESASKEAAAHPNSNLPHQHWHTTWLRITAGSHVDSEAKFTAGFRQSCLGNPIRFTSHFHAFVIEIGLDTALA